MTENPTITLTVNGRRVTRSAGAHFTLLRWLRDAADVTDPKYGCGEGICGACTVLVDDVPVSSCLVLAVQVAGSAITTAAGFPRTSCRAVRVLYPRHANGGNRDARGRPPPLPAGDSCGAPRQLVPLYRLRAHRGRGRSSSARGSPVSEGGSRGEAAGIRTSKKDELKVVRQPLARHDQREKIAG